ncbi:ABC transporter ATP-binding protein [Thermoactinomyces mirandus]|uniref:Nickel import system ATP-binding protein NikD n=1 Tax=Thermoactinomyces mirandus TaxID=2756294 RepID=A0A7W2ARQ6_9BACL|nr:ABC transporter ATP-binding protein [Thermoactinomyces mirandus]MBA4601835.1 ABC transporter ATP-binding protein [Thermoactinomyces mirandus]
MKLQQKEEPLPDLLEKDQPLLEVKDLSLSFRQYREGLRETDLQVISKLDITLYKKEIVAVVGASGSGKSLLASAILGLLPENAFLRGTINFKGKPLSPERQEHLRGEEISLIPQSVSALDPLMKTGKQVQAVIKGKNKKAVQQEIFDKVGLPSKTSNSYPFELSGGMVRRVLAATSLASSADLIIADEPTPGLDPFALKETVNYIKQLAENGKGVIFITHDIETALKIADKVAVFYAGQTVEIAKVENFCGSGENLRHPYTKALWNALPQNGFVPLPGSQPLLSEVAEGCIFHPRCPVKTDLCKKKQPESKSKNGEMVRCFYA